MFYKSREYLNGVWPHDKLVMIRAKSFGDARGVCNLAEVLFVKSDREGLDPFAG